MYALEVYDHFQYFLPQPSITKNCRSFFLANLKWFKKMLRRPHNDFVLVLVGDLDTSEYTADQKIDNICKTYNVK